MNMNLEAEQSLLGSIIFNNDLIAILALEEDLFGYLTHKRIFNHIKLALDSDNAVNQLSLKGFFGTLPEGEEYLTNLLGSVNSLITPTETSKILRELSSKRKLEGIALNIKEMASDESKNSLQIKDAVMEQIEEVSIKVFNKKTVRIGDAIRAAFSKDKAATLHSGFSSIDDITGGFDYGSLVILAGRPSMGKSSLAMNIALRVAKGDEKHEPMPTLFISMESSNDQFSRRVAANMASIHLSKLRYNNLDSQHEVEVFKNACLEADKIPLEIKDEGGMTLARLRYEIKRFKNKTGGRLIVIDYIQLIKHKTKGGRIDDITEITNTLKALAMEFEVVILGLSQLSRAVENREDKRPMLSDLRDSGSIEQDADVVIFAFRPEYYLEREKPDQPNKLATWTSEMNRLRGLAYAIVAKVRDGQCGDAKLKFEGQYQRFTE